MSPFNFAQDVCRLHFATRKKRFFVSYVTAVICTECNVQPSNPVPGTSATIRLQTFDRRAESFLRNAGDRHTPALSVAPPA